jgi:hypothetical protein
LVVALVVNITLDFINRIALLNHKVFAGADLILDGIEEHVCLLAKLLLDQLDVLEKLVTVARPVDLDEVFVAGVE